MIIILIMSVEKVWHRRPGLIGVVLALLLVLALVSLHHQIKIKPSSGKGTSSAKNTFDRSLSKRALNHRDNQNILTRNLLRKLSSIASSSVDKQEKQIVTVRRWSAEATGPTSPSSPGIYEWEAWGEQWVLRTQGDTRFLSPDSLVWREGDNVSWVQPPQTYCFVRGVLDNTHNKSDAALNICQGLSGVIQVGHLMFLMEPVMTASDDVNNVNFLSKNIQQTEDRVGDSSSAGNNNNNIDDRYEDFKMSHVIQLVSQFRTISEKRGDEAPSESQSEQNKKIHVSSTGSSYLSADNNGDVDFLSSYIRPKRFIFSKRHTIEVMVVVDHKMDNYHGKHVDQYVLTLMSVVSLIFRDSSIGNNIDIAVVEVVKPEGKSFTAKKSYDNYSSGVGKSAEEMLKVFCKWQKQRRKHSADHPHRYDTALLITRENICRNPYTQRCDTLGLAELGTMCSRYASCAIVQDNGLSAAFTIAHELGHLLNMPHDNDDKCSPYRENESSKHMNVMSRMLDHNTLPWIWSNCSRYYLTEYFQAGKGDCLEDDPWSNKVDETKIEVTMAGELFSASQQCQYVFGKTSSICPYMPKCKRLWCTTTLDEKEGCRTQHMPWADGTPCDKNRWCLRGECEPQNREELKKIKGEWGAWQSWSECSRSCGVGVRKSERFCDAPKPKYGGRFCTGERIRYESCERRGCSRGALDFRSQQCKQFNGKNFGLPDIPENVEWIPKYADRRDDSCKLFCQAHNSGFSYQLNEKVEDGTPCLPDSYDICVGGKCRVAGCDFVLNSTFIDDWCGVCNGDNSTCQVLQGTLKEVQPWGYSNVTILPEGAARIEIIQKAHHDNPADDNYLALVDYETGAYLLNGNWVVTPFEKMVEFGGSLLAYTGSNQAIERINSTKPLRKKLLVQILSVGKLYPPLVSYSFSKSNQEEKPPYKWTMGHWTECSRPCIGSRQQIPYCIRGDTSAKVADHLCSDADMPKVNTASCSLGCSVHWTYMEWSFCTFEFGKKCTKRRKIDECVTSANTAVNKIRCKDLTPVEEMECDKSECPQWTHGDWTPCTDCSDNSHYGTQMRLYGCYKESRLVEDKHCYGLDKPREERKCPCWSTGKWSSKCYLEEHEDQTTLELRQTVEEFRRKKGRHTNSEEDSYSARAMAKPYLQTAMVIKDPKNRRYDSCPWGKKTRNVICGSPENPRNSNECDFKKKPSAVSTCQVPCATALEPMYHPFSRTTTTKAPSYIPTYSHEQKKNPTAKLKESYISKGFSSKQDYQKGGQTNSLTTLRNRISKPYFSGADTLDSGEEEHNNLLKGRRNPDYQPWQVGKWSKCSKECGVGEQRRKVECGGDRRFCPLHLKPKDRQQCNTNACTEWTHSEWERCAAGKRDSCRGRKKRRVFCRNLKTGKEVNSIYCISGDEPHSTEVCKMPCKRNRARRRYKWIRKPWSSCSELCDGGLTNRSVTCIDTLQGPREVRNDYCLRYHLPLPRTKRRCNKHPCPFRWLSGPWLQCSSPCGPGIQKREINCHRVSSLGWVDPDQVILGCSKRKTPVVEKACNMGICAKGYFWVARPWKSCQAPCGSKGRQRRSVICVDFKGIRAQRSRCSRTYRPKRKQRCRTKPCGHTTCDEVRSLLGVTLDGEYSLLVAGMNMSVYCSGMNKTEPKEFLTLPAGEEGNYAEIYNKRLLWPDTCPFQGERNENCHCADDKSGRAGLTTYSKIRINTTSLVINTFDFTFSRAMTGRSIAFGEAGDCYSMTQCPQGTFSINLVGTSLKVSDRTTWKGHGNKASHWITRLDDSQRIKGKCGGYCGTCTPDPTLGLKLGVRITKEMIHRIT